jgi:FMN phosphatase YigB (HAD superfamily)
MIKGIFFATSNIFYKHEEPPKSYAEHLAKGQGFKTDLSAEDEARLDELKEQASNGLITAQAYWNEFFIMCGMADPVKRAESVDKILEQVKRVYGVPGAHETVRELKKRGFLLGVITRSLYSVELKKSWLEVAGVAGFIDVVVSSTEIGTRKPHPALYWSALNQAHLTPREAAYVGNGAKELAVARRVGMVTVAVLYESDAQADYYANTLSDLLELPIFQR